MSKLLCITSSPRGKDSESTALADTFLAECRTLYLEQALEVHRHAAWLVPTAVKRRV